MVSKQSDGASERKHVPNESEVTLAGDGGFDKGTGLYPMGEQSFTYTQSVDNTSTGLITGATDPRTYTAHTDTGPAKVAEPVTEPESEPAVAEEPEPSKRGPGRPRKTGGN